MVHLTSQSCCRHTDNAFSFFLEQWAEHTATHYNGKDEINLKRNMGNWKTCTHLTFKPCEKHYCYTVLLIVVLYGTIEDEIDCVTSRTFWWLLSAHQLHLMCIFRLLLNYKRNDCFCYDSIWYREDNKLNERRWIHLLSIFFCSGNLTFNLPIDRVSCIHRIYIVVYFIHSFRFFISFVNKFILISNQVRLASPTSHQCIQISNSIVVIEKNKIIRLHTKTL